MLTLTEDASTIVSQIITQQELGDDGGLRITAGDVLNPNLELAVVEQAQPGDHVVAQAGAAVYLDEPAATLLDDKVLHASVDEAGQVNFSVGLQG